jgi:fluoride exporter
MTTVVWVALGAAFGAPLRYLAARVIQTCLDTSFPWGTMTVNVTGCLIFGFLVAAAPRLPSAVEATLGIGFCGAFTTYSTFSYETLRLLEDGTRFYAVVYVGASLLAGFGAVGLGWALASWLTG